MYEDVDGLCGVLETHGQEVCVCVCAQEGGNGILRNGTENVFFSTSDILSWVYFKSRLLIAL